MQFIQILIQEVNLNGAQLFGCNWQQLKKYDLYQLDGHTSTVWSVCFSPDGNTLASGSSDKSIRLWDVKTRQQKAKLDGHSDEVRSVCFSPDTIVQIKHIKIIRQKQTNSFYNYNFSSSDQDASKNTNLSLSQKAILPFRDL